MDLPFLKEALSNLFRPTSCDQYPVKVREDFPGYRGRLVYHGDRCIACGMCERVCAGGAISRVTEKMEDGSEHIHFTINMGSCTFCSTCADFCSRNAIELTTDYHLAVTKDEDLLVKGTCIKPAAKKPTPKPAAAAAPAPQSAAQPTASAAAPAKPAKQAAPAAATPAVQPRDDGKPVSDPTKCVYCTLCAKKCPMGAIEVDRAAKTWKLNEDACIACGTCAASCLKKCILM